MTKPIDGTDDEQTNEQAMTATVASILEGVSMLRRDPRGAPRRGLASAQRSQQFSFNFGYSARTNPLPVLV